MLRRVVALLCVCIVGVGLAVADEFKAKVKSVDVDKSTITFTVNDKDQTLPVARDARISKLGFEKEKKKSKVVEIPLPGGLGGLAEGNPVVITTDKSDGKEVVTAIKLDQGPMKNKKKNKN